ncbi:MAG: glycine--tRNA ligase subunit beta, partial [Gammaproteobacteria bacterium]
MAKKKTQTPAAASLLVEVLTEELPPKSLRALSEAVSKTLAEDLRQDDFLENESEVRSFATPRRLAVLITRVRERAPDHAVDIPGPSVKAGLDSNGSPTPALLGFARKRGVDVDKLVRLTTPKGEFFYHRDLAKGGRLETTLDSKVQASLGQLPAPKIMRWGEGQVEFVRPVHGIVMMHGSKVVPGEVMGHESSRRTIGHRALSKGVISIKDAEDYERALRANGKVRVSFEARRAEIIGRLNEGVGSGVELVADDRLFDEITALVEAPTVYAGEFDPEFLEVPPECLILSMQQHQKYVPLRNKAGGKLLPRFQFVSNVTSKDARQIVHGNERVLRARLADAKFFYDQDRRTRLEAHVPRLAG